jgi:hypothetical protein
MISGKPNVNPPKPSTGGLGYQSGFNADRQPVNTGFASGRLQKESQFVPQFGSATGKQAALDLTKSQQFNDQAQLRRGMETANAQMGLENQVSRAELMQAGLSNQAKIYADMTQRATDQIGLAAQLQQAMIRNRAALSAALMSDT